MKKIVVLISGNGSNLQAIIDHCESGNINGEIACVVSNKDDAYGIQRAEASNIKTEIINEDKFESRKDFNENVSKKAFYIIKNRYHFIYYKKEIKRCFRNV